MFAKVAVLATIPVNSGKSWSEIFVRLQKQLSQLH